MIGKLGSGVVAAEHYLTRCSPWHAYDLAFLVLLPTGCPSARFCSSELVVPGRFEDVSVPLAQRSAFICS